jgi:hypothetical protein
MNAAILITPIELALGVMEHEKSNWILGAICAHHFNPIRDLTVSDL